MTVGAACTALPAFLFGRGIDQAYVYRSFEGVAVVAVAMIVIFAVKGLASYGQAVTLARIANHIVAENQKKLFDKLLAQNIAFYADRHSSEFAARITFGAGSAAQVLNLLINALRARSPVPPRPHRGDGLSGAVPVADRHRGDAACGFGVRKLIKRVRSIALAQYGGGAEILEAMQETIQGFRIIKAFNLEPSCGRGSMRASTASRPPRTSSLGCRTARPR